VLNKKAFLKANCFVGYDRQKTPKALVLPYAVQVEREKRNFQKEIFLAP